MVGDMTRASSASIRPILLDRVAEVTVGFWVIKTLATPTGEALTDFLDVDVGLGPVITTAIVTGLLALALMAQFATKRYISGVYWMTVVLIGGVGALLADSLTDVFGMGPSVTTLIFSLLLAATFGFWFARERTLSIHTIFTRRREAFSWAAILLTFALGTAIGDVVSENLDVGDVLGTTLFAALVGALAVARFALNVNAVFCFWAVYVLTDPLGSGVGDLISQGSSEGGLGMGVATTRIVFLAIIVTVATYLGVKVRRQRAEASALGSRAADATAS